MAHSEARAPTAVHGPLGITFHPLEKASSIADCLEKQITPHDLREENHKRQEEARVQDLLEAVENDLPERKRPCDLQKLITFLKLRKACEIDGIPNECLKQLPRRPLVHLANLFNCCIRLSIFPSLVKNQK
jgi:hypothetical protein